METIASEYLSVRRSFAVPRLPLDGEIDLTYRCNIRCRHCWAWLPAKAPERKDELTFDEIRRIAGEARAMGCRKWSISGGEPMLRPDFPEIFDYLTRRSAEYALNTNGTLITPAIAQLMKRKGAKMVALYGATAEVYDDAARRAGGFEQAMRGFAYLKEAGAEFMVQLVPMRANWNEWEAMKALAKSLSPEWRIGAPWLWMSRGGSAARNAEIADQRLAPEDVIDLDRPNPADDERIAELSCSEAAANPPCGNVRPGDDRLFAACIEGSSHFHIDPYGGMSFCSFVKDPALRFGLREGSFREAWDEFIPSLAGKVRGGAEYAENCGACDHRSDCRWCAAYGFLEQGRYSAPVPYLCEAAGEAAQFKENWLRSHRRYFEAGGITIQVDSDLPFTESSFHPMLGRFAVAGPGDDTVSIRYHFEIPELTGRDLGREVCRYNGWTVYKKGNSWIYLLHVTSSTDSSLRRAAVFSGDYAGAAVYCTDEADFRNGNLGSLTLLGSDQLMLVPLLAQRSGLVVHSAGVILDGQGLLFVGHAEAGKSTTASLLRDYAQILCDDRMIVRRWAEGFRIHGNWSHGDVPVVSAASAPLRAILFLRQSSRNRLVRIEDRMAILGRLLGCLIRPVVTAEWWEKTLDVAGMLSRETPCYEMEFDKSGAIVPLLRELVQSPR